MENKNFSSLKQRTTDYKDFWRVEKVSDQPGGICSMYFRNRSECIDSPSPLLWISILLLKKKKFTDDRLPWVTCQWQLSQRDNKI